MPNHQNTQQFGDNAFISQPNTWRVAAIEKVFDQQTKNILLSTCASLIPNSERKFIASDERTFGFFLSTFFFLRSNSIRVCGQLQTGLRCNSIDVRCRIRVLQFHLKLGNEFTKCKNEQQRTKRKLFPKQNAENEKEIFNCFRCKMNPNGF